MPLSFPPNCDTPEKKTGFCYRAIELLRKIHNHMGWWHRGFDFLRDAEGKPIRDSEQKPILNPATPWTLEQWNKFPQRIKNRYPYKAQLTQGEWDAFTELFDRLQDRVLEPLLTNRKLLTQSNNWSVSPDDLTNDD